MGNIGKFDASRPSFRSASGQALAELRWKMLEGATFSAMFSSLAALSVATGTDNKPPMQRAF